MIDESATGRSDAAADPGAEPGPPDRPVSDPATLGPRTAPAAAPSAQDVGAAELPLDLDTATRQALAALPGRSPDRSVCPFLRAGSGDDQPPEVAATGHRCVAVSPAVAVTDRQRQLVCQVSAHATCPRQTRGEASVRASLAPGLGRRGRAAPVAIGTAVVLLVAAAAVAATSGVATPGGEAAGGGAAGAGSASPAPSDAGGSEPSPSPVESVPSAVPAATVAPVPTVRPTLVATRDLPAAWVGLEACPAPDACYLYAVKSGDTFSAIAARFGTTSKKLRKLNPALKDPSTIRVGTTLRVPPPPS